MKHDVDQTVCEPAVSSALAATPADGWVTCALIIKEMNRSAYVVRLEAAPGQRVYFGRGERNDVRLQSPLVSRVHGFLCYTSGVWMLYERDDVTNPLSLSGGALHQPTPGSDAHRRATLKDNDILSIDLEQGCHQDGVQMIFLQSIQDPKIEYIPLQDKSRITIGRDSACDIQISHVSVSRCHAVLERSGEGFILRDEDSTNGVFLNNRPVKESHSLKERDVILILNTRILYSADALYVITHHRGIMLDTVGLVKKVGSGRGKKTLLNDINLHIKPGEFVAVIGGSGAGKSTLLSCMSGFSKWSGGQVLINGESLSACFDALKLNIGFVPQQDIVHDMLTLRRMLLYAARQRMPCDTTRLERMERVRQVLSTLELTEHADTPIRKLSGGQRKRASIAVELLADPGLFFLDEPTSGLDPGAERSLMSVMQGLSRQGKTVVLVTHTTLNLYLCDRIIVLGPGGCLCSCLSPAQTLSFYGVDDLVDVYDRVQQNPRKWAEQWTSGRQAARTEPIKQKRKRRRGSSAIRQFGILVQRYGELTLLSNGRMLALLVQAPLLGAITAAVSGTELFAEYSDTKSILFTLAVAGIWMGMLNAVGEICKERAILRRELMAGMRRLPYLASKLVILSLCYGLQSLMLVGVFCLLTRLPNSSILLPPFEETVVTVYLAMMAAGCMGLAISSLVPSADTANAIVPYLMVPQLVFSGILFELESGWLRFMKYPIIAYWGVNALGSSADLRALPMPEVTLAFGKVIPETPETPAFDPTIASLLTSWGALVVILVAFLALCCFGLWRAEKRR